MEGKTNKWISGFLNSRTQTIKVKKKLEVYAMKVGFQMILMWLEVS